MISYTVTYRAPGKVFWRKVKGVYGDGIEKSFRFLTLEDDTQIHFPINSEVIFSPNRMRVIEKNMSRDAGQPIQKV